MPAKPFWIDLLLHSMLCLLSGPFTSPLSTTWPWRMAHGIIINMHASWQKVLGADRLGPNGATGSLTAHENSGMSDSNRPISLSSSSCFANGGLAVNTAQIPLGFSSSDPTIWMFTRPSCIRKVRQRISFSLSLPLLSLPHPQMYI